MANEPPYSRHRGIATSMICAAIEEGFAGERAACAALFHAYLAAQAEYRRKVDALGTCRGKDAAESRREMWAAFRALERAARELNGVMGDTPVPLPEEPA